MAKATKKKAEKPAKMYIVKTPVKDFCGIGAGGVHFANGQAEIPEGWVLDWYREKGYTIIEKQAPAAPAAPVVPAAPASQEPAAQE